MSNKIDLPAVLRDPQGHLRKGRLTFLGIYFLLAVIPAALQLTGIEFLKLVILHVGEFLLPNAPGSETLKEPFPELIESIKIAASYIIYLFIFFLISGVHLASWLRDDLRDSLTREISLLTISTTDKVGDEVKKFEIVTSTVEKISDNTKLFEKRFDGINDRLAEIESSLRNHTQPRTINIALFDKLLIYTPLFVSRFLGFFKEEGLDVNFEVLGNDERVANEVANGDFQFGACDPFFAVRSVASTQALPDLVIVMPLCKRFGFSVLGTQAGIRKVESGDPVVIASYEAGSTTFVAASAFREWLAAEFPGDKVARDERFQILELNASSQAFQNQETLRRAMANWDFVVLWEPQTSWAVEARNSAFGFVGMKDNTNVDGPSLQIFRSGGLQGAGGSIGPNSQWRAWTPNYADKDNSHKCLISACVVARSLLEKDPELVRRMFRALSRANLYLHGLDWRPDNDLAISLLRQLKTEVRSGSTVDVGTLQSMVGDATDGRANGEKGGLFPFIAGLRTYEPDRYLAQLKACHKLWSTVEHLSPPPFEYDVDYDRFFVHSAQLEVSA